MDKKQIEDHIANFQVQYTINEINKFGEVNENKFKKDLQMYASIYLTGIGSNFLKEISVISEDKSKTLKELINFVPECFHNDDRIKELFMNKVDDEIDKKILHQIKYLIDAIHEFKSELVVDLKNLKIVESNENEKYNIEIKTLKEKVKLIISEINEWPDNLKEVAPQRIHSAFWKELNKFGFEDVEKLIIKNLNIIVKEVVFESGRIKNGGDILLSLIGNINKNLDIKYEDSKKHRSI